MEEYVLDRFEEEYAVLEKKDGTTRDVPKKLIGACVEGDVIIEENGKFSKDDEKTEERKRNIEAKMRKLFGSK